MFINIQMICGSLKLRIKMKINLFCYDVDDDGEEMKIFTWK